MGITEWFKIKGTGDFGQLKKETKSAQKSFGDFTDKVGKAFLGINQGLELASKAIRGFGEIKALADFSVQVGRLEKIVSPELAEKIQKATGGTISRLEAMKNAALALTGPVKLTEDQLLAVARATENLGKAGRNTSEVFKQMTEALLKGEVTELRKFGISVDTTKDKTEQLKEAMMGIREIGYSAIFSDESLDSFDRANAKMQDLADSMKNELGKAMQEIIIQLGTLAKMFNDLMAATKEDSSGAGVRAGAMKRALAGIGLTEAQLMMLKMSPVISGRALENVEFDEMASVLRDSGVDLDKFKAIYKRELIAGDQRAQEEEKRAAMIREFNEEHARYLNAASAEWGDIIDEISGMKQSMMKEAYKGGKDRSASRGGGRREKREAFDFIGLDLQKQRDELESGGLKTFGAAFDREAAEDAARQSALDRLQSFNDKRFEIERRHDEELRSLWMGQVEARVQAVEAWAGAASAAADVLEEIFGKEKAIVQARAIIQIAVEIAEAYKAFAYGNFAGGAAHTLAAAKWSIVAAKAGGGGGGGGGAPATAGGGFSRPSNVGQGGGGVTYVFNIQEGFVGDPDELATRMHSRISGARRKGFIPGTQTQGVVTQS